MTRYNDSSVGLYDRAPIANNVDADLFISIHANSVGNGSSAIKGIQVLYHSKDKANVKKEETLALAQIMMESTRGTGHQIKVYYLERTVVIRDTNMSIN